MDKLLILYALLIVPGLARILSNSFHNLYLWQIKEYRFDRVWSYIRFEKNFSRKQLLLWFVKLGLSAISILYLASPNSGYLSFTFVVIFLLYFSELQQFVFTLYKKRFIRPGLKSSRNLIILFLFFSIILITSLKIFFWLAQFNYSDTFWSSLPLTNTGDAWQVFNGSVNNSDLATIPLLNLVVALTLLGVLVLDLCTPVLIAFMVFITAPLSSFKRKRLIQKAKEIVDKRGNSVKIIGITGSYGKTTTKDLIYKILKEKYKVAKTVENHNTAVGIAQSIISKVKPNTEIFIAEAGAYKIGEIKEAIKIIPLDVAVITALTQQHLSLFGSKENLFLAKYELIEGLKKEGVAVLNGNDDNCLKMAKKTRNRVVFYYPNSKQIKVVDDKNLYLVGLEEKGTYFELELIYKAERYTAKVSLKSPEFVLNLMAAMTVCLEIGMDIKEIIRIIESFPLQKQYLNIYKGKNNSQIIIDGRTSNMKGFELAIDFLDKKAKGFKWIMTQGILELGSEKEKVYRYLSRQICSKTNGLITSDMDLANAVSSRQQKFKIIFVPTAFDFIDIFNFNVKANDTVLVEGAFPKDIIDSLILDDK